MRKKPLILLVAALLVGCNLPPGGTSMAVESSPVPSTDVITQATVLTLQPAGEELETPTASPLPSATETEQPSPQPAEPTEIKFLPGGTIYFIQGEIAAGQHISYTFTAAGGQTLLARVSSNDLAAYFEIMGLNDESALVFFSERRSSFISLLPEMGTYQITLTSEVATVYFLTVEIPVDLSILTGSGPQVVNGRVEVLEDFHPNVQTYVRYILPLDAGTTLNVQLNSDAPESLSLALIGVDDGVPYLRHVVKSAAINDFSVMVSQDYFLDVYSVSGEAVDYNLEIEVN